MVLPFKLIYLSSRKPKRAAIHGADLPLANVAVPGDPGKPRRNCQRINQSETTIR
jgi:hypothetical protein